MTEILLGGRRLRVDPSRSIGKGGEADVFDIGNGLALKLYKGPDHPDLRGLPEEQRAARERLRIRQRKLREFPPGLPERVVAPLDMATDRAGRVVGYAMTLVPDAEPLQRFSDPAFRRAGIASDEVRGIFLGLHDLVFQLHRTGVVIGDFNDLNVLVAGGEAHLIDADSFQFGPYLCEVFTERFLDPLLSAPSTLALTRPYGAASDWYAFAVMWMQSLLYVGPYGGVYRPARPQDRLAPAARPLHRVTVFHPEVIYPRPAIPYGLLPDDVLETFRGMFEKDRRGVFPRTLVESLRWTRCSACGREHARAVCPGCRPPAPAAVREVSTVRGRVTATRIFRTDGVILEIGPRRWLVHEDGEFRREDGRVVRRGPLAPDLKARLMDRETLFGCRRDTLECNDRHRYWEEAGRLLRDGPLGPEHVGDVLAGQTRFWAGPEFGVGFYRAANLSMGFVFDAERRGIRDGVALPLSGGRLVDAHAVFGPGRAWLFLRIESGGRTLHRCALVRPDGSVESVGEGAGDDGTWLGVWGGKCAAGPFLFAATDAGVVRVETGGAVREFPDTEPFVDSGCRLAVVPDGLMVATAREIFVLKIS